MIQKIFMCRQISFSWPIGRVHLACVIGGDHWHFRMGGPNPFGSISWPHGGYIAFQVTEEPSIAAPQQITQSRLTDKKFYLIAPSGKKNLSGENYLKGQWLVRVCVILPYKSNIRSNMVITMHN